MKLILVFILCCAILNLGCASRSEKLAAEYERIAQQGDAVQLELKETVNAQNDAQKLVESQNNLAKRLDKISKIQEENDGKGYPIGNNISSDQDPKEILQQLNKNYEFLSQKMDELRKEKGRITEEQIREKD